MLANHSLIYLLSRMGPGLLGFLAIALFSRLLDTQQYGLYALVLAVAQLLNAVLFQWLRASLSRFLPVHEQPRDLLAHLHGAFWWIAGIVGVATPVAFAFVAPLTVALGAVLTIALAWYELGLEVLRADTRPARYALLTTAKALLALAVGVLLVVLGLGGHGVIAGLVIGSLLPTIVLSWRRWPGPRFPSVKALRPLLDYGLPLTGAFALGFVINSSDRLLIAALLDASAVGEYAAGYDLARQSIFLLTMGISLASFPIAVRALKQGGRRAARIELRKSLLLIYLLGIPATVGISVLAPNISSVMLGSGFQDMGSKLLPWIAVAALLSGVREFHANRAFQLAEQTRGLLAPTAIAAVANIVLNLILIPRVGVIGAAYATLAAFALSLVLTWWAGHRRFPIPFCLRELAAISLCAGGMGIALAPVAGMRGPLALVLQVAVGIISFGMLVWTFDVGGTRAMARQALLGEAMDAHGRNR